MNAPVYTSPVESWSPSALDLERFWSKVHKQKGDDGCWIWRGDKSLQIRWGAFGTRESILRVAYFLANDVWPDAAVRRTCESRSCLRHIAMHPELVERRRGVEIPTPKPHFGPPLTAIECTHCRKQKPETSFYQRKGGGFVQPCRNCYQARAKKRDAKAADIMAKQRVLAGSCVCGCHLGAHRSGGKGGCSTCGDLKCPSFFERGL